MKIKGIFIAAFICLAALTIPQIASAQSCTSCPDKCKNQGDACRKDIEKLTPACFVTGQKAYCDQAKKRGCKSAELYCRAFCFVDFGSPTCPDEGGSSDGDPHQLTFDGRAYMMQAAGDFILTQTVDRRFAVHIRQVPNGNKYSVNQAVGVRLDDLIFRYDMRGGEFEISVTGETYEIEEVLGDTVDGVAIKSLEGDVLIVKPGLAAVRLRAQGNRIGIYVTIEGDQRTEGLLGNRDGNSANDLPIPDDIKDFYGWLNGTYADGHRVTLDGSLLPYLDGETPRTFWVTPFPRVSVSISDQDLVNAELVCVANGAPKQKMGQCIYDVALTGDRAWAKNIMPVYRNDVDFEDHPAAELLLRLEDIKAVAGSGAGINMPGILNGAGDFWKGFAPFKAKLDLRAAISERCGETDLGSERCSCFTEAFTDPALDIDSERREYLSYILTHPNAASGRSNIIEEISKYHQNASGEKRSAADVNSITGEDYRVVYGIGNQCVD